MSDVHPSFGELLKNDEDRKYAKEQIMAVVRQLQAEGKNTHAISQALFDVTMDVCKELPTANRQYHFLEWVRDRAQYAIGLFDAIIQKDKNTEH